MQERGEIKVRCKQFGRFRDCSIILVLTSSMESKVAIVCVCMGSRVCVHVYCKEVAGIVRGWQV